MTENEILENFNSEFVDQYNGYDPLFNDIFDNLKQGATPYWVIEQLVRQLGELRERQMFSNCGTGLILHGKDR